MSARVEQIIEVIQEVRENFLILRGQGSITNMRIDATHSVADRLSITYRSVLSKYIIQLKPDISTAREFDRLIGAWLNDGSNALKEIVMKYRSDPSDIALIENAFYRPSEEEALLAEVFGYDPNDKRFREGKDILRLHLAKERNQYLIQHAKTLWSQQASGNVRCSVCAFSFADKYGHHGSGYIEAHHTLPVSYLKPNTVVRIKDIVPVCSNCHSIIHRSKPLLTFELLKQAIMLQENTIKKQDENA